MRRNEEKAEMFAQQRATKFQPHDIQSHINPTPDYQKIKLIKQ